MNCPFCNIIMQDVYKDGKFFQHKQEDGPLLTKESGSCPYQGTILTNREINNITIFLLDNDMGD